MIVRFTQSAREQYVAAVETIRRDSATAARRFQDRVRESLKRLERFPDSGALVPEFPDLAYREVFVPPYRFFYRVQGKTVWVVDVWHGTQLPDKPENL